VLHASHPADGDSFAFEILNTVDGFMGEQLPASFVNPCDGNDRVTGVDGREDARPTKHRKICRLDQRGGEGLTKFDVLDLGESLEAQ
jgi:hypothetical protein